MLDPRISLASPEADAKHDPAFKDQLTRQKDALREYYRTHYLSALTSTQSIFDNGQPPSSHGFEEEFSFTRRYQAAPSDPTTKLDSYFTLKPCNFSTTDPVEW